MTYTVSSGTLNPSIPYLTDISLLLIGQTDRHEQLRNLPVTSCFHQPEIQHWKLNIKYDMLFTLVIGCVTDQWIDNQWLGSRFQCREMMKEAGNARTLNDAYKSSSS